MDKTSTPPPGAVWELAEQAVSYVRASLGITLDYSAETLPVLDHYLRQIPPGRPELVGLTGTTAGAYFGEVVRQTLDGEWRIVDEKKPATWQLFLPGGLRFSPVGFAVEAITQTETDEYDGNFEVPPDDLEAVSIALEQQGQIPSEQYYSLCGRLETLMSVIDVLLVTQRERSPSLVHQPDSDGSHN
ncbi:MAG: hypothetical protein V2A73_00615 [Pseudomonadota bacterium]